MIACGDFRFPARFHHGGGIGFAQQRRSLDAIARAKRFAVMHRGGVFSTASKKRDAIKRRGRLARHAYGQDGFAHFFSGCSDFRDTGFDNHLAFRRGEAKAPTMRFGEFRQHSLMRAESDGQEGIGAGITQMQSPRRLQACKIGALARQFFAPGCD